MIEIALRVPQETVRALLSAAAEALMGAEGRAPTAAENEGFWEETFHRLSRAEETGAREALSRAEDGPEDGTAAARPRRLYPRRAGRQSGEGAESPSPVETAFSAQGGVLPERGLREAAFEAEEAPVRRGSGTAGRRLSAPEPASYAVERALPAAGRTLPAEKGSVKSESGTAERPAEAEKGAAERGTGLSPKALSDRWERDSRRYDGGFTLY